MLHEAMRSYYAPLLILLFFGVMVLVDKLFSQKIKRLFLLEIFLQLLLMAVTSLISILQHWVMQEWPGG